MIFSWINPLEQDYGRPKHVPYILCRTQNVHGICIHPGAHPVTICFASKEIHFFFFLIRKHASLSQTDIRTRLNPNTLSATLRHQGNLMQTQTILVGTTRFSGCTRVLFSMFLLHPIFNFLFILNVHDNMIWLKDNI